MNGNYTGRVSSVVYSNGDFRVLRMVLDGGKHALPVMVKGNFRAQSVVVGSWVSFEAKWEEDARYGKQLSVTKSPTEVPTWTTDTALSALSGNGVGADVCQKLRSTFGDGLVEVLDSDGDQLADLFDEFTVVFVSSRWRSLRLYLNAMHFLIEAGVPQATLSKVWSTFDVDVEAVITTDPWALVRIDGIDFQQADEVAQRLGVSLDNPGRIRGAVFNAVESCQQEGHLYASVPHIIGAVTRFIPTLGEDYKAIANAIAELGKEEVIIIDRDTRAGTTAVYTPEVYRMSNVVAGRLVGRLSGFSDKDEKALNKALRTVGPKAKALSGDTPIDRVAQAALDDWTHGTKISLTDVQRSAAARALACPVSVLTGLPGTGKTTTLKAVVSVLREAHIKFALCAPTGIAAKRMSSLANAPASTIHRAFGAQDIRFDDDREATYAGIVGERKGAPTASDTSAKWKYDVDKPHPAQVVIIDECSMMDLHLLYRVLVGTSESCRLVFVGDPEQLPSVGAGDVLRDLAKSAVFPVTRLTEIFRQSEASGIVIAAHAIHNGQTPAHDGKDFIFIPENSDEAIADKVLQLAESLYRRRSNFQTLSPRHGGEIGVTNLNHKIRVRLNPGAPGLSEIRLGKSVVREDDRVMVIRNNYDLDVYNGDTGKVARIDRKAREVEVKIHGPEGTPPRHVRFAFSAASRHLRLAYVQTVHKCQGSEYDVIVMPMSPSFGRQLQRNLFYTAVTRARSKVILVGSMAAVGLAVANDKADKRHTLLSDRIKNQAGGRAPPSHGT
jgi:exodeoxyribonuclease V alpha subunit